MDRAKAVVAMMIAQLAFAIPIVNNGVTVVEFLGILLAGLVAYQGVYWTENK